MVWPITCWTLITDSDDICVTLYVIGWLCERCATGMRICWWCHRLKWLTCNEVLDLMTNRDTHAQVSTTPLKLNWANAIYLVDKILLQNSWLLGLPALNWLSFYCHDLCLIYDIKKQQVCFQLRIGFNVCFKD